MAERLKLVPVFLTELLGSLGGFQRVGLAGHRPLYHLLTTTNSSTLTAATIIVVFFFCRWNKDLVCYLDETQNANKLLFSNPTPSKASSKQ